jgi:hypothetical protein
MISIRTSDPRPASKPRNGALLCASPVAAFVLSVPALLASLPSPHSEIDYLVVGSAATFFALLIALLIVTLAQVSEFERAIAVRGSFGEPRYRGDTDLAA